jgi:hypothetical protein
MLDQFVYARLARLRRVSDVNYWDVTLPQSAPTIRSCTKSNATQNTKAQQIPLRNFSPYFHDRSYYIVALLLAAVLLTLPSSPDAWKVVLMPWRHGSAVQESFPANSPPLHTP